MAQSSRPCDGCGTAIPRTKPTGVIPPYCSDDCKPRCSVEGCDGPARKRGWCASHYAQQRVTGKPPEPFKWKWGQTAPRSAPRQRTGTREPRADVGTPCRVCDTPGTRRSWYCSEACYALWLFYKGNVPRYVTCVGCGVQIDLLDRHPSGARRQATTKFCRPCKQDYRKYKMSARHLAERDGTDCGICGEPVDMSLSRRDSIMCPSVDHVIPRAHGGTHDPENLQLAHLYCNHVKSDRLGFAIN